MKKIRLIIGKKGISLRSLSLLIVFSILCVTIFMNAVYDGTQHYDKTLSERHSESFEEINGTLTEIDNNARDLNSKVESIKENPLTAVFFIPAAIIDALQLTFNYVDYVWNVYTQLNKTIGIPDYIKVGLEVAVLMLISYLIIDAFMRFKKT